MVLLYIRDTKDVFTDLRFYLEAEINTPEELEYF